MTMKVATHERPVCASLLATGNLPCGNHSTHNHLHVYTLECTLGIPYNVRHAGVSKGYHNKCSMKCGSYLLTTPHIIRHSLLPFIEAGTHLHKDHIQDTPIISLVIQESTCSAQW